MLSLEELNERSHADNAASGSAVGSPALTIETYEDGLIVASADPSEEHSRKGGTIAGHTIFRFFDGMAYMVTLAQSPPGTEAYTIDVNMYFLRPGPVGRVIVEGRPLKFGRRSSVVSVTVSSPLVSDGPIAHGIVTFAPVFPQG